MNFDTGKTELASFVDRLRPSDSNLRKFWRKKGRKAFSAASSISLYFLFARYFVFFWGMFDLQTQFEAWT